jgi:hypothetical protein
LTAIRKDAAPQKEDVSQVSGKALDQFAPRFTTFGGIH